MTVDAVEMAARLASERMAECGPECWTVLASDLLRYADRDAETEDARHWINQIALTLIDAAAIAGNEACRLMLAMFPHELAALRVGSDTPAQSLPAC